MQCAVQYKKTEITVTGKIFFQGPIKSVPLLWRCCNFQYTLQTLYFYIITMTITKPECPIRFRGFNAYCLSMHVKYSDIPMKLKCVTESLLTE